MSIPYTQPEQRIGDYERDNAIDALREHMAAGRLTPDELDDRVGQVLQAKTQSDLDQVFVDLPADPNAVAGVSVWQAPQPAKKPTSAGRLRVAQRWMIGLVPLLLFSVLLTWHWWVPVIVAWVAVFLVVNRAERRG